MPYRFSALCLWFAPAQPWRNNMQSVLNPGGPNETIIQHLFWFFFAFCLAAFVLLIVYMSIGMARHQRQAVPAPVFANPEGDQKGRRGVIGAVVASTLALFLLLAATVRSSKANSSPPAGPDPVTIQLIGHQWWWQVNYLSRQPGHDFTTANEIHLPVGVPIHMLLTSVDVIHSFWVPSLRGKRDLLPGYQTDIWFRVKKPLVYRGQCAQFCGAEHAEMGFLVVAESAAKYHRWLLAQRRPAAAPATALQREGQQVFLTHACILCHTIRGTQAGSNEGPDLTHLASRKTIGGAILVNDIGNLGGWIENPQSIKPGVLMPPNPLPPQQLTALLAYLEHLR
jgi:cytochrome c oxidase subunit 2